MLFFLAFGVLSDIMHISEFLCFFLSIFTQFVRITLRMYNLILEARERLLAQLDSLKVQLDGLPEGRLICSSNGKHTNWYVSNGHKPVYLPKSRRDDAEKHALRVYLEDKIKELEAEIRAYEFYLRHHREPYVDRLLAEGSRFRELLLPYFQPFDEIPRKWQANPIAMSDLYPEQLTVGTLLGHKVRSKSEAFICDGLYSNGIPYVYEYPWILGGKTFHMDVTIWQESERIPWEHNGIWDNVSYRHEACRRLDYFGEYGLIPDVNLIVTYETAAKPFSARVVDEIIRRWGLKPELR